MISRTYTIRNIEAADCEQWEWRAQRAEARGDSEEAQALRDSLAKWEKEQGQERERLVCAVCQSGALLAGILGDRIGIDAAIVSVAVVTAVSGLIVLLRVRETLPSARAALGTGGQR